MPRGRIVLGQARSNRLSHPNEELDDVRVAFDGAGVKWVPVLLDEGHKYHRLLGSVREHVDGACAYCARAYGVKDAIEEADFPLSAEYRDHPSLRTLIVDGYEVVTF